MNDPKQAVMDELTAARDAMDSLVNSFAPSSPEDTAMYNQLRSASEGLTAAISEHLARPFPGLAQGLEGKVTALKQATSRLRKAQSDLAGVKEAIELADYIVKLGVSIATPD